MQDKPKRTFIAIKVIPDHLFLKKYNLIRNKLKHEDIRWVNPGNFHITLRFIGDTPEGEIVKIKEILDRVVSDIATFNFGIQGIDLFRSIRHPRVLWMGMNNTHALIELKNKIDEFLNPLFNLPPNSSFSPHLTLGRMKRINNTEAFRQLIANYREDRFLDMQVREVIFFESVLKREGAVYEILSLHKLKRS